MSQIVSRQAEGGLVCLFRIVALELSGCGDITDLSAVVDQPSIHNGEVNGKSTRSKVKSELSVVQGANVVDGEGTCLRLGAGARGVRRAA